MVAKVKIKQSVLLDYLNRQKNFERNLELQLLRGSIICLTEEVSGDET